MCLDESKCIAFFVKNSCRDFYYPLPMKFGEGNVFTGVCLSMGLRVSRSLDRSYGPQTWDLDTLPLRPLDLGPGYPTPSPDTGCWYPPTHPPPWTWKIYPPITDILWSSLETCSNLFTWGPTPTPIQYWHLVEATKRHTVGKRVVGILLECCLVFTMHAHARPCVYPTPKT